MKITLRTHEEFRDAHVIIELVAAREEAPTTMTDPDEIQRLNRQIRELGDRLRAKDREEDLRVRRVTELEAALIKSEKRAAERETQVGVLRTVLRTAEEKISGYDADRRTEKARADQNREWAEREDARCNVLNGELEKAERRAAGLKAERDLFGRIITRAAGVIHHRNISEALNTQYGVPDYVRRLQEVVETVRTLVAEASTVPSSPAE